MSPIGRPTLVALWLLVLGLVVALVVVGEDLRRTRDRLTAATRAAATADERAADLSRLLDAERASARATIAARNARIAELEAELKARLRPRVVVERHGPVPVFSRP